MKSIEICIVLYIISMWIDRCKNCKIGQCSGRQAGRQAGWMDRWMDGLYRNNKKAKYGGRKELKEGRIGRR